MVSIEKHGFKELHTRDTVGHRVVDACGDSLPTIGERPDHIEGPQWPAAVEVLRHQITDDSPHIGLGGGRRGRRAPDVIVDVEVRRWDPSRISTRRVDTLGRPWLC